MKNNIKKYRNWNAVAAHHRNSAGPIKDQYREQNKNLCREKIDIGRSILEIKRKLLDDVAKLLNKYSDLIDIECEILFEKDKDSQQAYSYINNEMIRREKL